MDPLTYRAAGVDIRAGDEVVRRIAPLAASTLRPEVLGGLGAFAAFCRVPFGLQDPVLVSSTLWLEPMSSRRVGVSIP